jgi:hypothetical protein
MPRVSAAQGEQMPLLRAPGARKHGAQETVPALRGFGIQEHPRGRSATGAEEDPEDHGLRGLREAGLGRAFL